MEGSHHTAEEVEEKKESIARIVVAVGLAEADHKDCVGKEPQGCMVGVGVAVADKVKDVGELGGVHTRSIAVGFEGFGIAAETSAEEQRADENMG